MEKWNLEPDDEILCEGRVRYGKAEKELGVGAGNSRSEDPKRLAR